ncbi:MAG TPA: TRAP transporter large permease [Hyphomonadaceae bacterium]|jgi:tripartite ATP-independent transporter DctM subunit|nr:TRAP transporter large permease [Hyphomonadaceae bacterium]
MALGVLFAVFAGLLLIGTPVAAALAVSTLIAALVLGLPEIALVQQMTANLSSVSLLAIPLFVFAGELMLRGGISERIISLAAALVGRIKGGLGQVSVVASTLFGGVSGSAIADVSAVGGALIPQMIERGYQKDFAVNVTISAALIALLVPPSHNMILFSAAAGGGISITDLFLAGIFPALLLAIAIMVTTYLVARKRGYEGEPFPGFPVVLRRLVSAIPGLLLVGIIFFGIKSGIFTAIESATIAVIYAVLITVLVYRKLKWADFIHAISGAVQSTGRILFVIGAAGAFGWLMAYLQAPAMAVEAMQAVAHDKTMVLLLMVFALLVLGTFMDMAPLVIIATPIFLPVARAYGVDPVHFGVIMILSCGIGLLTPPVGSVLFIGAAIGKIDVAQTVKGLWPFYIAMLVVLLAVVLWPPLSLSLPAWAR